MESKNVPTKAQPFTKQEIKHLVTLIESSKIINSASTNAVANKLKNEEWVRLTEQFKTVCPDNPRTHQQLRYKWDNLKKSARKRIIAIQENQWRLANGKEPEFIPPDDILERVTKILTGTVEGFANKFQGDSVSSEPGVVPIRVELEEVFDHENVYSESSDDSMQDNGPKKRRKFDDDGRKLRNLAIAEYYAAEKILLDATYQNMRLENEKLKLEINKYKEMMGKR